MKEQLNYSTLRHGLTLVSRSMLLLFWALSIVSDSIIAMEITVHYLSIAGISLATVYMLSWL